MTVDEAYRRGQRDMRDRIIKQFRNWVLGQIATYQIVLPGVRPRGDVGVSIRAHNKIVPHLPKSIPAPEPKH